MRQSIGKHISTFSLLLLLCPPLIIIIPPIHLRSIYQRNRISSSEANCADKETSEFRKNPQNPFFVQRFIPIVCTFPSPSPFPLSIPWFNFPKKTGRWKPQNNSLTCKPRIIRCRSIPAGGRGTPHVRVVSCQGQVIGWRTVALDGRTVVGQGTHWVRIGHGSGSDGSSRRCSWQCTWRVHATSARVRSAESEEK